ncbi:nucleotidyltransferase domain-containing protein [Candidatus Woesearchaeota archaeon]|nr:nucleotidyltransferase domain-containing protein [Candidatus Woesearchaeota archaeon]
MVVAGASEESVRRLFGSVAKGVRPRNASLPEADRMIRSVNSLLKKARLKAVCVAGGSYAKGTALKDNFDVDLFVRFDYSYKNEDISALLARAISSLKPEIVHGSRDYFQIKKGKLLFEVIPVLRIDDYRSALNVTDMSPLHVVYIEKRMKNKPALRDEVRLAKQFCKGIRVYGAESYIRGFSGHVLELLIVYYGSFEQLLKQAALWGERVVIDIEHHWKDPLRELNYAKTISPLVIVDPIQPDRNAAAAVSKETFDCLRVQARRFLESPSGSFFKVRKLSIPLVKKRAGKDWLVLVKAVPLKGKDDIMGSKVLKVHEHFQMALRKHEFKLLEAGWEYAPVCTLYYIIKKERFSDKLLITGPPVKVRPNADQFREKHKSAFENRGRLFAEEKRLFKVPGQLLKALFKEGHIKDKVKRISLL